MKGVIGASLLEVHTSWSWIVIIGNGLAGAWALRLNGQKLGMVFLFLGKQFLAVDRFILFSTL